MKQQDIMFIKDTCDSMLDVFHERIMKYDDTDGQYANILLSIASSICATLGCGLARDMSDNDDEYQRTINSFLTVICKETISHAHGIMERKKITNEELH